MKRAMKKILLFIYNKKNRNRIPMSASIYCAKKNRNITVGELTIVDENSVIGDYSYVGRLGKITKATIGRYCSIGDSVIIGPGEHDTKLPTLHSFSYGENKYEKMTKKECIIGNDVWIGAGAIILRGVTIGNGAVIGASAVVTKNVEPYTIVAGVPAKYIRHRIGEELILRLENDKWWDLDIKHAIAYHKTNE